ncbi:hypothetical protein [Oricola sp.]|uniref:hypothetical protein n=1 Tax=Oricola sp. TaxID=1979950 RepID=UPI0025F311F1|nr:hypothetical protein [Oricola sp.]MCI5076813.1 hypothetical protein [Oricola sp.]
MKDETGMNRFDWTDAYPGRRIVTLVLDLAQETELLGQAADEGRLIAPGTVLGMPKIARDPQEEWASMPMQPINDNPSSEAVPAATPGANTSAETAPDPKIAILPVVRRESMPADETPAPAREPRFDDRSPLAEKPPRRQDPPREPERRFNPTKRCWERRGTITGQDLELVETAVAEGRVTKCPPATFALDANDARNVNWGRQPKSKAKPR